MTKASNKRVSFDPYVTGIEIMSIDDYTHAEISAAWYDYEEMDKITQRCVKIIQKMAIPGGIIKGTKKYCIRGLEGHSTEGSIAKNETRSAALLAVLTEQSRQGEEHRIADVYRKQTFISQMKANRIGQCDREIADVIHSQGPDCEHVNGKSTGSKLVFCTIPQ